MSARLKMLSWLTVSTAVVVGLAGCGGGGSTGSTASTGSTSTNGAAAPATDANVAGDIPDSQAFVAYTPADGAFTVNVPEGWAQTAASGGVVFSDKYNRVEISAASSGVAPTVDSVKNTEVPALSTSTPGFGSANVTTVTRKAGQGILVTYTADSAPNSVTGKVAREAVERYEFFRRGTKVTLTLSAPEGSDNVDPWRTITDSFHWPS